MHSVSSCSQLHQGHYSPMLNLLCNSITAFTACLNYLALGCRPLYTFSVRSFTGILISLGTYHLTYHYNLKFTFVSCPGC